MVDRVQAQAYAAPGMLVQVQRVKVLPKPAHAKVKAAMISPVFLRFWHQSDSARVVSTVRLRQFQDSQTRYPATSLRAGIGGKLTVQLTVLSNGKVGAVRITRREMDEPVAVVDAPTPAAEAALEAEVIRVVSQLRFEPASLITDTVSVTQRFIIQ